MRDKDQQFIFNDEEISLIKSTFGDDDTLLYAVRKVLLQFPLTPAEKALIKQSVTPEVHRILKKRILPEISDEFPLNQLPSILTTLTQHLQTKSVEEMAPLMEAKKVEIEYLNQRFLVIENPDTEDETFINLTKLGVIYLDDPRQTYINLSAYLFLLGYIDPMLTFIKSIAGEKTETVEEAKARMDRNSSK